MTRRMRRGTRVAFVLAVLVAAPPAAADHGETPAGDAERGRALTASCVGCHGPHGRSVVEGFPHLAGQRPGYLIKQLRAMRRAARQRDDIETAEERVRRARDERFPGATQRRRWNPIMDPYVVGLGDQQIRDLAAYYAVMDCRSRAAPVPPRPAVTARCAACHGDGGVSGNHMIPTIAGQNETYLLQQVYDLRTAGLAAEASGDGRAGGMMNRQAAALTDDQIAAVAAYYAALPCAPPPQR